jgi:hypothetical protein
MIINKGSWHYKYYSWLYKKYITSSFYDDVAETTNLCNYVQIIFWFTLVQALMVSSIIAILFGIGKLEYQCWSTHPIRALIVHSIIPASIGSMYLVCKFFTSDTTSIIAKYISAKKNKICPIVEFKDED